MPVDHHRKHAQLHNVLDNEEVVEVVNSKGEVAKFKLDHAGKQVFIEGGPEEDCAWKKTNGSYDDILKRAGLQAQSEPVLSGVESTEPVEPLSPAPAFPASEE
jgi:hypothetical protein